MSRHPAEALLLAMVLGLSAPSAAHAQSAPSGRAKASSARGWRPMDRGVMRIDFGASQERTTSDNSTSQAESTGVSYSSVSSTKVRDVQATATADYVVVPRLAIGVRASLGRFTTETSTGEYHSSSYSIGPALTVFVGPRAWAAIPYVQLAVTAGTSDQDGTWWTSSVSTYSTSGSARLRSYSASAGLILMFAPQVGADLALEYHRQTENVHTAYEGLSGGSAPEYTSKTTEDGIRFRVGMAVFVRP